MMSKFTSWNDLDLYLANSVEFFYFWIVYAHTVMSILLYHLIYEGIKSCKVCQKRSCENTDLKCQVSTQTEYV